MNLLSGVRLGVSLKLMKTPRVETLNEILVRGQLAHFWSGRPEEGWASRTQMSVARPS